MEIGESVKKTIVIEVRHYTILPLHKLVSQINKDKVWETTWESIVTSLLWARQM